MPEHHHIARDPRSPKQARWTASCSPALAHRYPPHPTLLQTDQLEYREEEDQHGGIEGASLVDPKFPRTATYATYTVRLVGERN
jgi:hypothetical protein